MAVPGDEDSWTKEVDFEGKEWKAIDFFAGTFNGNGFTFKNMKGCFAKTNGGTIKDLTFENATISTAESSSAGLILTNNGTLENITMKDLHCCNYLDIGIGYHADTDEAIRIMEEEILRHPLFLGKERIAKDGGKK